MQDNIKTKILQHPCCERMEPAACRRDQAPLQSTPLRIYSTSTGQIWMGI